MSAVHEEGIVRGAVLGRQPVRLPRPPVLIQAVRTSGAAVDADSEDAGTSFASVPPSQDFAQMRQQARDEGHAKGYEEGLAQGREQAQDELKLRLREATERAVEQALEPLRERARRLDALLASLAAAHDSCLETAEDDAVALCHEAIVRILGDNAVSAESVRSQVQQVFRLWRGTATPVLLLHPDDAALLDAHGSSDASSADPFSADPSSGQSRLPWRGDASVTLGGCVVLSEQGELDARLETQMKLLADLLLQARRGRGGDKALRSAARDAAP